MCSRSFFVHITFKSSKAKKGDVQVELYIYNLDLNHEKLLWYFKKTSSSIFQNASLNMMFATAKNVILNLSIMTQ